MLDNYLLLPNGLIKQDSIIKFKYGAEYSKHYDRLGELSRNMSFLRLGFILGALNYTPKTILDIGYGNGDFLKTASNIINDCYGYDIGNEYLLPANIKILDSLPDIAQHKFDVVCLFDVLEHFDNIYDIKNIQTSYVCISVPNCNYQSDEWFKNWKHRKPNEHIWHFNEESLKNFFTEIGYKCVKITNIEDTIRKDKDNTPNILTGIFEKI